MTCGANSIWCTQYRSDRPATNDSDLNAPESVPASAESPAPLSQDLMARIRAVLAGRLLWCPLPGETQAQFVRHRQESFVRLVLVGWPLLVLLFAMIALSGPQLFGAEIRGQDAVFWWRGLLVESVVIAAAVVILHFPFFQRHYQAVIVVAGCISLAIPLLGTLVLESQRLMRAISYVSMLIITIQVLVLKLSLLNGALATGLGVVMAVAGALWLGATPDWALFSWHALGSVVVNLFIAAVQERQERISFLQSLLLEHESAERERLNAILARHAAEDQLTGLPNRRSFNEVLLREWERSSRTRKPLALLFMDVDYFKRYNDSLGHLAGDECLATIACAIRSALRRPADMAARYGGEEFVVLLPETEEAGAMDVAQRVLAAIDACAIPHPASAVASHVTSSIGVAVMVPDGTRPQLLVDAADAALYEAKGRGRHRIVLSGQ